MFEPTRPGDISKHVSSTAQRDVGLSACGYYEVSKVKVYYTHVSRTCLQQWMNKIQITLKSYNKPQ